METKKDIEALERFIEATTEMLSAENHLAVVTKVDFRGVWTECYNARKFADVWLAKLKED